MQERARRLNGLTDGWVRIEVAQVADGDETIHITVTDSGSGFDVTLLESGPQTSGDTDAARTHGRGFALLRALCSEVTVPSPGNVVHAVYRTRVTA
jgi:anti-sigma regulatory factor (Ser/Thr protein kinase)